MNKVTKVGISILVLITVFAVSVSCFPPGYQVVGGKVVPSVVNTSNVTAVGGTAGRIPYFVTNSSLGNSIITNAATYIFVDGDIRTDRWLFDTSNTFLGDDVVGAGTLAHTGGIEGWENTSIGHESGHNLTTGYSNTLVGYESGNSITSGYNNTFVGEGAGQAVTSGHSNVALGDQAMMNNIGIANTAIGHGAMGSATNDYNTSVGMQSMNSSSGEKNTAIGVWAGQTNNGNNNVFLGYRAGEDNVGDNKLYVDNSEDATPLIYGDFSIDKVTINEDLEVADDGTVIGTLNLPGDAQIKTNSTSARDLTIVTGADKTLVLDTVVFEDVRVAITSTKLAGTKDPGFSVFLTNGAGSQGVFTYWFDASAEEEVYFTVQIPHSYKLDTVIVPHVHWIPKTTADGVPANQAVRWGLEYTWADYAQTFANTTIIYGSTHLPADANVVANKHYMTDFTSITPNASQGKNLSSMLVCRLFRDATSLTDNYEHDAGLLEFDIHFGIDTIGSRTVTTK